MVSKIVLFLLPASARMASFKSLTAFSLCADPRYPHTVFGRENLSVLAGHWGRGRHDKAPGLWGALLNHPSLGTSLILGTPARDAGPPASLYLPARIYPPHLFSERFPHTLSSNPLLHLFATLEITFLIFKGSSVLIIPFLQHYVLTF